MSYMTISSQEKHNFSLCSCFHAHPTTLLLKILGGKPMHGRSHPPQILGGPPVPLGLRPWRRHTRAYQGKYPCRNASLAAALAVKSGNNKIEYQDILTALADATNDLSMPCHEQRMGRHCCNTFFFCSSSRLSSRP